MKIYVIRHGETDLNKRFLVSGITNAQLTEKGIAQAEEVAKKIKEHKDIYNIKHIYVSPLDRAINTAKPIEEALELKAEIEAGIIEFNFGKFEKCKVDDKEFRRLRRQPFIKFQDGESILSAAQRIYSVIDKIIEKHKKDDSNVLLVCHATSAKLIYTYFNDIEDQDYYDLKIKNCELIAFEVKK